MSRDVVAMFAATDRNDADGFIAHLAPDVKYVFANSEPVIGRETVKKNTIAFWGTMDGVVHHICRIHEVGDTVIVEFDMEYRRKDGTTVHVPCCDVLTYDGDLISEFSDLHRSEAAVRLTDHPLAPCCAGRRSRCGLRRRQ